MKIDTVDPYIPHYVYIKQTDPNARLVWRQFRKGDVEAVDKIVALSQGMREKVTTSKDWEVFENLLGFYAARWPQEFNDFLNAVKQIRESRRAKGYSKTKEIMYVGTIPLRFMKIVKIIFPEQEFDKQFIWKMVRKIKMFKVTGENNMSKGGEII